MLRTALRVVSGMRTTALSRLVPGCADHGYTRLRCSSFAEASTIFGDPLALTVDDPDHLENEKRFLTTGRSDRQRIVIVWHTDRNDRVRLIGARDVTPAERHAYQEESG